MVTTEIIETLRIEVFPGKLLRLSGTLNTETAQAALRARFDELHADIRRNARHSFTIDLRRLEFVNSSAIRLFVDWISRATAADYKLVFEIDLSITWHRLNFQVLKTLSPECVEVVDGGPVRPWNSLVPESSS